MWCLHILHGAQGVCKKKEMREWTTPLNPTGYLCKRLAAHGCIALCAITLPRWVNPLLNREFHRDSHPCRNALAVTSLAAAFSGFSENENSWRTKYWVRLDLVYKNWSQGIQSSANEFSAASLWEKGMTNDIPSRKIRRENTICEEGQKVPLFPQQITSWEETVSGSLQRYLY